MHCLHNSVEPRRRKTLLEFSVVLILLPAKKGVEGKQLADCCLQNTTKYELGSFDRAVVWLGS